MFAKSIANHKQWAALPDNIFFNITSILALTITMSICEIAGRTPFVLFTLLLFKLPFEFRLFGESNQKLLPERKTTEWSRFYGKLLRG